jgi:glycosyltransferase involved in cell wall biosynthesis
MKTDRMNKPAVILYLIDTFISAPGISSSGGAEKQLFQLATGLNPALFRPILIQLAPNRSLPVAVGRIGNAEWVHLPIRRLYTGEGICRIGQICRMARLEDAQIIHTFFEKSEVAGWLASVFSPIPVWVTSRRDLGFKRKKVYRDIFKFSSRRCDRVVANCLAVKDRAVQEENLPAGKIEVIRNGLDLSQYELPLQNGLLRKELGLSPDTPLVGMVANFNFEIKGHRYLIEAAKALSAEATFLLVGDGPLRSRYEQMVRELGLGGKVRFLGKRNDIPSILSGLDIAVLSSTSEGLSNVILESMAAGKPVVVTDVGGNSELVRNGVNGYLVPPADSRSMAGAIDRLLRNPGEAARMGRAGKSMVQDEFSPQHMVERYEKLYAALLAEKGHRAEVFPAGCK